MSSFKDFSASPQVDIAKLTRIGVINFYSLNYSNIVQNEIDKFVLNLNSDNILNGFCFLLKLASQSSAFLNIISDKALNRVDFSNQFLNSLLDMILRNDKTILIELFNCLRQLNNSISVYDLITNVTEWLSNQSNESLSGEFIKFKTIIVYYQIFNYLFYFLSNECFYF